MLTVIARIAATMLLVAASASGLAAQTPQHGGTLVYVDSAVPPTTDCHAGNTFAILHVISPHYSLLVRYSPTKPGEIESDLAASWSASADGVTHSFRLHPNIKFHDGTPLTSADIRATFQRIKDPPQGVISQRKATLDAVAAIETPDPQTVVFRLREVDAAIYSAFASPWSCMYSAKLLAMDPNYPAKQVMGSGPFVFDEYVPGAHWTGKRFEQYFLPDRPYLDGFKAVMLSGAGMVNSLAGGQVMAEFRGLAPAERDRIVAARGDKIRIIEANNWVQLWRMTINARRKPFDDVRVRRALNLAFDRWGSSAAIARISFMGPVGSFTPPGSFWSVTDKELEAMPGFSRDIKAARAESRRLLTEAGVPNLSFKLLNRTLAMPFTPLGIFAVDQWRQIGVAVENVQLETAQWQNAQDTGNFDVMVEAMAEHIDDPSVIFNRYLSTDRSPINYSGSIDRTIDALFDKQRTTLDRDRRRGIVREFDRYMLDQAYTLPIFWTNRIIALAPEIHGWAAMPSHFLGQDLRDVWLEH
ncbi:MAG: ABC transporter substrate-binding protein [Proteobacteria bacterium]|nr:ABC transporter substrate-binding protein [Pseudomonadota bacterium]